MKVKRCEWHCSLVCGPQICLHACMCVCVSSFFAKHFGNGNNSISTITLAVRCYCVWCDFVMSIFGYKFFGLMSCFIKLRLQARCKITNTKIDCQPNHFKMHVKYSLMLHDVHLQWLSMGQSYSETALSWHEHIFMH